MTIFIAGIHGAGKTYLAKPAADRLGMHYATASQLIKEERGRATWGASKEVSEIDENQVALIAAVKRIKATGQALVLDGHFVLFDSAGRITKIDEGVYRDLGCEAAVLLTCPPSVALARLAERDGRAWTVGELAQLASEEASQATLICASLAIPLYELAEPTLETLVATLAAISPRQADAR